MYNYQEQKKELFTEDGLKLFTAIRDQINRMLKVSGAVKMGNAISLPKGIGAADTWELMACVDHMVSLGELIEVPTNGSGQDRVFVSRGRF